MTIQKTQDILYNESGVSIDRCHIITGTGNRIDLTLQMLELNIFEDIFSPALSATILLHDTLNLIEKLPIIGQEWMFISISKPGMSTEDGDDLSFDLVLRVYKIEKLKRSGPFVQTYLLHCTEEELILSNQTRWSRSYVSTKPEVAIKDIFTNCFQYDSPDMFEQAFDVELPETLTALSFTIPNLKPFEAIAYIASIAKNNSNINDYLFFGNNGGYRFESLSKLFEQDVIMNINYKIKNILGTEDGDGTSSDPYLNSLSPNDMDGAVIFDYLQGLIRGEYGIQADSFDISRQAYKPLSLGYDAFNKNYKGESGKLNKFTKIPKNDWKELASTADGDVMPYYRILAVLPKVGGSPQSATLSTDFVAEGTATRLMSLSSITNQKLKLSMPGSPNLKVGNTINLEYPAAGSHGPDDVADKLLDTYLSAKYLITSVRHVINLKTWTSFVELSKDSLPTELPAMTGSNYTLEGL